MSDALNTFRRVPLTDLVKNPKDDIVDGPFGSRLKASEYVEQGVPIVRLQNIDRNRFLDKNIKFITLEKAKDIARHHFVGGDILVSKLGDPLGEACIAPDHISYGILVADVVRVRPNAAKVDADYLAYALNSSSVVAQFTAETKGTTRPRVNLKKIRDLQIPFAESLPEQRRIVAEIEKQFTRLDEGVAALRRVQANLKRYRAAVLKAACEGKLVPTEAELAKKKPKTGNRKHESETGEALLARILKERHEQWKGRGKYKEPTAPDIAQLSPLPEGWTWASVDAIGFVTKLAGFEYTKYVKYSPDGDLAVIKAENAGREGFKSTEISRIRSSTVAHLTRSQLRSGDLLMVFVGAGTGNVARVPDDQAYFLGPNIAMIRVESKSVSGQYLEMFLRSPIGHSLTYSFIKAVAQPSLSMGTIRAIPVAFPPIAEQTRIVAEVERRLSVVEELERVVSADLQYAGRLRQSILRRSFRE